MSMTEQSVEAAARRRLEEEQAATEQARLGELVEEIRAEDEAEERERQAEEERAAAREEFERVRYELAVKLDQAERLREQLCETLAEAEDAYGELLRASQRAGTPSYDPPFPSYEARWEQDLIANRRATYPPGSPRSATLRERIPSIPNP